MNKLIDFTNCEQIQKAYGGKNGKKKCVNYNFDKWDNYQELLNYKIIIMNRNNIDINYYIQKYNTSNFIVLNDYPYIDISSTEIRNNLDNNNIDDKVLNYIKEHKLYR